MAWAYCPVRSTAPPPIALLLFWLLFVLVHTFPSLFPFAPSPPLLLLLLLFLGSAVSPDLLLLRPLSALPSLSPFCGPAWAYCPARHSSLLLSIFSSYLILLGGSIRVGLKTGGRGRGGAPIWGSHSQELGSSTAIRIGMWYDKSTDK